MSLKRFLFMPRTPLNHVLCGWAQAAAAIGDQWSILIVRDAFKGVKTFSAFQKSIGVSKGVLSRRLEHLVASGILAKAPVGLGASHSEYSLTPKGKALLPAMLALAQWSDKWVFGEGNEPYVVVDALNQAPVPPLEVRAQDGRRVELEDLTILPGPGCPKSEP